MHGSRFAARAYRGVHTHSPIRMNVPAEWGKGAHTRPQTPAHSLSCNAHSFLACISAPRALTSCAPLCRRSASHQLARSSTNTHHAIPHHTTPQLLHHITARRHQKGRTNTAHEHEPLVDEIPLRLTRPWPPLPRPTLHSTCPPGTSASSQSRQLDERERVSECLLTRPSPLSQLTFLIIRPHNITSEHTPTHGQGTHKHR